MNGEILAFIVYFVAIVGVGIYFFFKEKGDATQANFFLGGRQMGPWVAAMSAQASDMSAWLLMGLPGSILAFGFGQMWIGIGLALGTAANWIFVAKRLRKFSSAAGDAITVPQYLGNRFLSKSNALQVICAIIFFVCFTIYVASAYVAGASVFTAIFPSLSSHAAMIIIRAGNVKLITFFGGFKAVCWTDFFQGILMFAALMTVPIVIAITKDMDPAALSVVYSYKDAVSGEMVECSFGTGLFDASWQDIISGLAWGLGYRNAAYPGKIHVHRKKPSMVKKKCDGSDHLGHLCIGMRLPDRILRKNVPGRRTADSRRAEDGIYRLCEKLFPSFIAGILMAAIIAASMSTADSQLLVASSSFTSDIYKPIIRKDAG